MSNLNPKQRLLEWTRVPPEAYDYDDVIVAIPVVFSVAVVLWWTLDVRLYLALVVSNVLAFFVLVDALYLNPPQPRGD